MDTGWMSQGKCKNMDPAVFFPSDGVGVQAAQRICAACPVADFCLEYALLNHIDEGVWGGASERHRRRLLRQQRRPVRSGGDPMAARGTTATGGEARRELVTARYRSDPR
jgi:WhiB family redox-sensing transcriptional regulator